MLKNVASIISRTIDHMSSPELPLQILAVLGAAAVLLVALGLGVWNLKGAYRAFLFLIAQ